MKSAGAAVTHDRGLEMLYEEHPAAIQIKVAISYMRV